jgi:hypothetical protein
MVGCDAEMEFDPTLAEMFRKAEEAFPAPEFTVVFADAQDEDEDDTMMIARRYNGVLISMVFVTLDELDGLEAEGEDWVAKIAADLARTQAEIDAEPEEG